MKQNRQWVVFFSQTGSEIADICESIGRWPTRIITNKRPEHLRTIDPRIVEKGYLEMSNKPTANEYLDILQYLNDPLITLHGWLRVMPKEVCLPYDIFNGHPGLITWYPELKGKDPQVRAYEGIQEGKYESAGAVLHKVTEGVDEGKIISEQYFGVNKKLTLDDLFRILRDRSLYMWCNFLKKVL